MEIENGGNSQHENDKIAEEFIRRMFTHAKLDHDTYNVWHKLPLNEKQWKGPIEPLQHYEERIRRAANLSDLILQLSDPEAVAAYNRLVDEFNAALPEINRKKYFETTRNFWERARKLIYSEKE